MAWNFGDSWDLYTVCPDALGYWDAASSNTQNSSIVVGRFANSRACNLSNSTIWMKTSGVNDPVHHLVVAFQQTSALTGTSLGLAFTLMDGTTAQCSVVFRSDGAILLVAGVETSGTVLATYTGAFTAANVWTALEFEVVIGAAGSFTVRKNGNNVADFTATGINTQASANAYANKLQVGANSVSTHQWDDFFWRSGSAAGSWIGDIRCYTRWPASDITDHFTVFGSTNLTVNGFTGIGTAYGASSAHYMPFTPLVSGAIASATINFNNSTGGGTGHVKLALFADNAGQVGTLLATSSEITNPAPNTIVTVPFATPPRVTRGQNYWLGFNQDASISYNVANVTTAISLTSTPYASWPVSNPGVATPGSVNIPGLVVIVTPQANADAVGEAQQDGLTTYVYDSNPGDADVYAISPLPATPASIAAVTTRGLMTKSDAGLRTAAIQLQSGATLVATPTLALTPSSWQWAWRTDLTDPNTGAAWTAAAVNAAQIGPTVVA